VGTHLREELFYRLSVFQIEVPPLRDRKEDISPIADLILQNMNKKHGTRATGLDAQVLELFERYDWPGNVRELRNALERAAIVTVEGPVRIENLPSPAFGASSARSAIQVPSIASGVVLRPGQPLEKLEEAYIKLTLEHVHGNRKLAAEMLGISLRTLQNRIAAGREEARSAASGF
jgi:DNA-binding NtrC family response regulator